jgi:hypothetical protein
MQLIDEEGRLFGAVNVIDAFVVLLVLAALVAGLALVTQEDDSDPATRYVTLDLGSEPEYLIDTIEVGDTATVPGQTDSWRITDKYVTPAGSSGRVILRVAVSGQTEDGQFTTAGVLLRLGRAVEVQTGEYLINGTITGISEGGDSGAGNTSSLPTGERRVVLHGTVPSSIADRIRAGSQVRVGNSTVATIDEVAVYDAEGQDGRSLYVAATLRTVETGGTHRFGGTPVEPGRELSLPVAGTALSGTVERVGGGLNRTTETVRVTSVVDASVASQIDAGDTYTVAGRTVATVESVSVEDTDDPDRRRVTVELGVQILGDDPPRQFAGRPLVLGSTLSFRTQTYEFTGEVVSLGGDDQPDASTDRLVPPQTGTDPLQPAAGVDSGVSVGAES